jgi:hypothetical protein
MLQQPRNLVPFVMPRRSFRAPYDQRVLALNPIAYWKLDDTSGSQATDYSGNGYHGAYSGATLAGDTFLNGDAAPSFDGVNDFVNVYSAGFAGAFDGNEGTVVAWAKVANAGTWADGVLRFVSYFRADGGSSQIQISKFPASDLLFIERLPSGIPAYAFFNTSSTDFIPIAITWSKLLDETRHFASGSQQGATSTGIGTWSESLEPNFAMLGAYRSDVGNASWHGAIAHVSVFDYALSPAQVADISQVA